MLCAFLIFEAFVVCLFVLAFFLERAMTQREARINRCPSRTLTTLG